MKWFCLKNILLFRFDFARDAAQEFNDGNLEKKHYILSRLGSNLILKEKIMRVDLDDVLTAIKEAAKEVNEIHERLEPVELIDRTSQIEASYEKSLTLLPD